MTSNEKARKVCRNLSRAVTRVTPRGLGRWGPAWDYVEAPSVAFLDALAEFEVADPKGEDPNNSSWRVYMAHAGLIYDHLGEARLKRVAHGKEALDSAARDKVQRAAVEVVGAWKRASREWERARRPIDPPEALAELEEVEP